MSDSSQPAHEGQCIQVTAENEARVVAFGDHPKLFSDERGVVLCLADGEHVVDPGGWILRGPLPLGLGCPDGCKHYVGYQAAGDPGDTPMARGYAEVT